MKIVTSIEVNRGHVIPPFYGVTRRLWDRDVVICHLIPFNVIIGLLYDLYVFLRVTWIGKPWGFRQGMNAYWQGFNHGLRAKGHPCETSH